MSTTPTSLRSKRNRRAVALLVVAGIWFFSAPVAQWLLDLSPEGVLAYRLVAVVILMIAIVLDVRDHKRTSRGRAEDQRKT